MSYTRWLQHWGTIPHYDVSKSKRILAVVNGAELVSSKDMVRMMRERKEEAAQC